VHGIVSTLHSITPSRALSSEGGEDVRQVMVVKHKSLFVSSSVIRADIDIVAAESIQDVNYI
jgi:hypothetical protein